MEFYLVIIGVFAVLFGYAKASTALARRREQKAVTEMEKAKTESSMASSSSNMHSALLKALSTSDAQDKEPESAAISSGVIADKGSDAEESGTPSASSAPFSKEEKKETLHVEPAMPENVQKASAEQIRRIRRMRGL